MMCYQVWNLARTAMRRVFILLILALWIVQVSAQDGFNFPVINLEEYLADGISVEIITYLPTYITDDEQRVVHYLDYEIMEWKYIDYPNNETEAYLGFDFNDDVFFRRSVTIHSGDYDYNLETKQWELPKPNKLNPTEYREPSDEFCGLGFIPEYLDSGTWNVMGYEHVEDHIIVNLCNIVTNEKRVITTIEAGEACEISDPVYFSRDTVDGNLFFLIYGIPADNNTRICSYDVGNQNYNVIGDIEKIYDDISLEYRQNNKFIFAGITNLDAHKYGIHPKHLNGSVVDLFEINLNEDNGIKHITQNTNTEFAVISGGQLHPEDSFQYIWAESISENEESIYLFKNNDSEPQFLFTREHSNQDIKFYKITLSPSGEYVSIQEPHFIDNGRLNSIIISFYTVDGEYLHTEEFDFPYPHMQNTFWLDNTTTVVLPQNYANPYEDLMHPLTVIRIVKPDEVTVTQLADYLGIYGSGHSSPLLINGSYYYALAYDDSIQLYDIKNDLSIPLIITQEIDKPCFVVNGVDDNLFLTVWDNCRSNGQEIFRAELKVSINPSGD